MAHYDKYQIEKVNFIVEKTNTGYSAYHENSNSVVATNGDTVPLLKANMLEACNLQKDYYY